MDGKGRFEEDATGMRWMIHQWFSYLSTMRYFYRKTAVDNTLMCTCVCTQLVSAMSADSRPGRAVYFCYVIFPTDGFCKTECFGIVYLDFVTGWF